MILPDLGVGINFSIAVEPLLRTNVSLIDVLLIEPQSFWLHTNSIEEPYRYDENVIDRIKLFPSKKIIHGVTSPVGGSVIPDLTQLPLFIQMINNLNSPWASEHLSFNRACDTTGIFNSGFFLPPLQTYEGVRCAINSIQQMASRLPVPFAVETGVNYLRHRSDDLSDGEFVSMVVEATNCGIVLDLHNLWTNESNGRQTVSEFLDQIPLDKVWEVHLAGGQEEDGYWLDAHSGEIPTELLELSQNVIPRLPNLHAIIFELYAPDTYEIDPLMLKDQLINLHKIWNLKEATNTYNKIPFITRNPYCNGTSIDPTLPQEWENALAALVIGREPTGRLGILLSNDPGINIYKKLIQSFRASMIAKAIPLTTKLLMGMIGEQFNSLLSDYWSMSPPEFFSSDEAKGFISFISEKNLKVKYLKEILTIERAVMVTQIEGGNQSLWFDYDVLKVVETLQRGKIPTVIEVGTFKAEVTPGRITFTRESDNSKNIVTCNHPPQRHWNH